jgi:hypothetical protein
MGIILLEALLIITVDQKGAYISETPSRRRNGAQKQVVGKK